MNAQVWSRPPGRAAPWPPTAKPFAAGDQTRKEQVLEMGMPQIKGPDRNKPLCYDPGRGKFITFDEIISGKEQIVPLERLSDEDLKLLVIERQRVGPDYRVQAMSGPLMSRDDVVEAILRGEPFGLATIEADSSHLRNLLAQIKENLRQKE
jgi:hypothetical protein